MYVYYGLLIYVFHNVNNNRVCSYVRILFIPHGVYIIKAGCGAQVQQGYVCTTRFMYIIC